MLSAALIVRFNAILHTRGFFLLFLNHQDRERQPLPMIDYNPRLNRYHVRLKLSFGDLVLGYFSSYEEAVQALRVEQMRQEG